MIADTPTNRILIRTIIVLFRSYAPFCAACVAWGLVAPLGPACSLGLDGWFWSICVSESLFSLFFLWYGRWYVQRAALHPPVKTRRERQDLFRQCQREIRDPRSFVRGWFRGGRVEDVGRDELRRFVDWSFWDGRADWAGAPDGDAAEMEEYIDQMERMMSQRFVRGAGTAKSLRLTLDPVEMEARSLLWYGLIMLADTLALVLLQYKGFVYHRSALRSAVAVFPPRPAAFFTQSSSVVPPMSYFLRAHTSKTRLPVVYIHGIGIGLLPSVPFLEELDRALNDGPGKREDQVGILVVEVLQISSRLTKSIPRRTEFLAGLTSMIDHHFGPGRFVLGAHSYGTVFSAQILRDHHLAARVSGSLLIDPVSCLLHMPDVAYNFTCRPPVRANEWLLWYFASKDPQVAHTLGRHFFWTENVLWRDQIDQLIEKHGMRLTASIASDDLIVDAQAVRAYLENGVKTDLVMAKDEEARQARDDRTTWGLPSKPWRGIGLETMWWQGHDHGEVFGHKEHRAQLIRVLKEYSYGV